MKIGVLALQGAFIEHQKQLDKLGVASVQVRLPEQLADLDGLIIPGGESTTISQLATDYGLLEPLRQFAAKRPTWGTCAGMIFLAKAIGDEDLPLLGLMDITVERNAFGRQLQSFETPLDISVLAGGPFHAIFIRAPLVTQIAGDAEALARLADGRIVAVRQGHLLATAFHPELTPDTRLHAHFLTLVEAAVRQRAASP